MYQALVGNSELYLQFFETSQLVFIDCGHVRKRKF